MSVSKKALRSLVETLNYDENVEAIRRYVAKYFPGEDVVSVELFTERYSDDEGGTNCSVYHAVGLLANGERLRPDSSVPSEEFVNEIAATWDSLDPAEYPRKRYDNPADYARVRWELNLCDDTHGLPVMQQSIVELSSHIPVDLSRYTLLYDNEPVLMEEE